MGYGYMCNREKGERQGHWVGLGGCKNRRAPATRNDELWVGGYTLCCVGGGFLEGREGGVGGVEIEGKGGGQREG